MLCQVAGIAVWVGVIVFHSSPVMRRRVETLRRRWSSTERDENADDETEDASAHAHHAENFEPLPPGANVVVSIRGLVKSFDAPSSCLSRLPTLRRSDDNGEDKPESIRVLKGLDMDVPRGQVFGFLGHNGAGP